MIFKSRQVNLDPEPWRENDKHGFRHSHPKSYNETKCMYDPRPEFEPTRDPYPWVSDLVKGRGRFSKPGMGLGNDEWAPRRERFDTPVNRVLAFIRPDYPRIGAAEWLRTLDEHERIVVRDIGATPEEIEHARKVLMRLAGAA